VATRVPRHPVAAAEPAPAPPTGVLEHG